MPMTEASSGEAKAVARSESFGGHARTVMGFTLLSRISGLMRDAVCSRVFGAGAEWSAFVTAFIIPNLFRRLFGEGAISAAFIPEYARLSERDPALAHRFASLTVGALAVFLSLLVLIVEFALIVVLGLLPAGSAGRLTLVLAIVMLPFMPLVCITAMLGGMLQSHGRFVPHAASPILLNVFMAGSAAMAAWWWGLSVRDGVVVVAVSVLVAGFAQVGWCLWSLRGIAIWTRAVGDAAGLFRSMLLRMGPVIIGMGTLQLGTLIDGVLAGYPVLFGATLPGGRAYPMDEGSASVLFYASRLYQFPLGVFGIAIATAVFPALARAAGNALNFRLTLSRSVRLSLFIGIPATVGIMLVSKDLATAIYRGGAFSDEDVTRTSATLSMYALAIWAYSLTHVLTRAFYAVGMTKVPMRVGLVTVLGNVCGSIVLMWWLQERGLALATAIAACGQTLALSVLAMRLLVRKDGANTEGVDAGAARSVLLTVGWSVAMMACILMVQRTTQGLLPSGSWSGSLVALARDVGLGAVIYLGGAVVMRRPELGWLLERPVKRGADAE